VVLGLQLGAWCLVLEVRPAAPSVAMTGLFGASAAQMPPALDDAALPV
jgi:hypothetical protein